MSIIKGHFFKGRPQFIVLCKSRKQEPNLEARRESEHVFYVGIYSIRGYAQVGGQLKGYWREEFL